MALRTCSLLLGSTPNPVQDTKTKSVSCPVCKKSTNTFFQGCGKGEFVVFKLICTYRNVIYIKTKIINIFTNRTSCNPQKDWSANNGTCWVEWKQTGTINILQISSHGFFTETINHPFMLQLLCSENSEYYA